MRSPVLTAMLLVGTALFSVPAGAEQFDRSDATYVTNFNGDSEGPASEFGAADEAGGGGIGTNDDGPAGDGASEGDQGGDSGGQDGGDAGGSDGAGEGGDAGGEGGEG